MESNYTNVRKDNFITIIEVNNPPANTLSSACIEELRVVLRNLSKDEDTRAIILTGAGKFFVAGADIKEFVAALGDEEKGLAMAKAGQDLCNEIESMNKPVIAAINGAALGGGLELAMACHYRIAATAAFVGLPELKLGLLPSFGGTYRLTKLTDASTSLNLILTSKQLTADEAKEHGIVQLVVAQEELLSTARTIAQSFIEGKSMTSITKVIECIVQGSNENLQDALERERRKFAELFLTSDADEGINAFIEKRKPNFTHA